MTGTPVASRYSDPKAILFAISDWTKEMIAESDYNVFFHFGKSLLIQSLPGVKPEQGFAKWRELGYEAHSQVADPLFADATHDDYRLKPESPALKVGFKPIPVEKIGLYASPDRVTWPVDETHGIYREEPLLTTPWPAAPKPQ